MPTKILLIPIENQLHCASITVKEHRRVSAPIPPNDQWNGEELYFD